MEAPKEIWLLPDIEMHDGLSILWYEAPHCTGAIEYTRTDAFIEKACKGIEHLLSGYIIRNFHFGDSYEMDTLIEDFKKYMEE